MILRPREPVIMAEDFKKVRDWYRDVLELRVSESHEDTYHYCILENDAGIKVGIADAKEMGITASDRPNNPLVLQFEVPDVKAFFAHLAAHGIANTFGPSYDEKGKFWFGGFPDIEGNPCWVVDENCV